jgi:CRISPR-associated protein Cmr6
MAKKKKEEQDWRSKLGKAFDIPVPKEKPKQKKQHTDSNNKDSFKLSDTNLPLDTRGVNDLDEIDNFNLKFQKAARFISDPKGNTKKDKFYFYKNDYNQKNNTGHSFQIQPNFDKDLIDYVVEQQKSLLPKANLENQIFEASIEWRLAIGLGNESVYETSISLHYLYGIPYIPASSIKGIVRSWIVQSLYGVEADSEARAFSENENLCRLLGCPEKITFPNKQDKKKTDSKSTFYKKEKQGEIIFFDAFPTSVPKLEVDILNSHYPDYYNDNPKKEKPTVHPTDTQSPNPVNFLTVTGCKFQFMVHAKDQNALSTIKIEEKTIIEWLKEALENYGIGAKTAVGYGYMS